MPRAVQEQPRPHTVAPADIDLNQELTCGFAHKFIRHKSRQLVGRCGIRRADRADLDQDLKLHLMRRFGQFDHVRIYAEGDYLARLRAAGFAVETASVTEVAGAEGARRYQLNPRERLFIGRPAAALEAAEPLPA